MANLKQAYALSRPKPHRRGHGTVRITRLTLASLAIVLATASVIVLPTQTTSAASAVTFISAGPDQVVGEA